MAWRRAKAVTATILMNKNHHEPNSPAAMLFLLILRKVHHLNELILAQKILLELTAFVVFSWCSFLLRVLAAKWNLPKSWWPCGAGASVSRIWVNSTLLPAPKAERTRFPGRTPHLECKKIQMAKGNLRAGIWGGRNGVGRGKKKIGAQRKRRKARQKQAGHKKGEV